MKPYKAQMFNRGKASQAFKEVVDTKKVGLVIRNSEPYVIILPYDDYMDMLKKRKSGE